LALPDGLFRNIYCITIKVIVIKYIAYSIARQGLTPKTSAVDTFWKIGAPVGPTGEPHGTDYIRVVTGELSVDALPPTPDEPEGPPALNDDATALPEWIDRERWGWLSPKSVRRLVQKAGSEELAREKLEMIIYNEAHGPPERRVRSRRSVLAYYLSSPQAEI
jgi:hypothetical protein